MNRPILLICAAMAVTAAGAREYTSPSGRISVDVADGTSMTVKHDGAPVLSIPSVGVVMDDVQPRPRLDNVIWQQPRTDSYTMIAGKTRECSNSANEYMLDIGPDRYLQLRVYDDGIAFRYLADGLSQGKPGAELTAYRIPEGTTRWMQKFNESYEDFFPPQTSGAANTGRWGYPSLIQTGDDTFALISEAGIKRYHSASSLHNTDAPDLYRVVPDANDLLISGSWSSPWRVVAVGSLADIVESTLVTDVSEPSTIVDTSWIKPGVVSWVYWAYNRGSKDYQIVKKYIDMAGDLDLPYVLIDWEWDVMGNGGTIEDAIARADSLGVRTLVWYNSSTAWTNNGAGGPLFRLNKPEDREKEFAWLQGLGIAGVKIDFFSGDIQPTMEYCIDLLESAARHNLLVNFHGATIPRGWQRTYPNMLSVEAVYGAEWYNNAPVLTNRAAAHNATLPFTRNVIGPMDYTPCTFSDSQHPHITSDAHELALTVVFESALQHLADRPESYLSQPSQVRDFLSNLPTVWDETRLLGGYPGDYVVMARRSGNKWYVGVLNGRDEERTVNIDWTRIADPSASYATTAFADAPGPDRNWRITADRSKLPASVTLQPRGGYVCVIEK